MILTDTELRTIRHFGPPPPGRMPYLNLAYDRTWRSLAAKGLVIRVNEYPELTKAGEELLALMLGGYTVTDKAARA